MDVGTCPSISCSLSTKRHFIIFFSVILLVLWTQRNFQLASMIGLRASQRTQSLVARPTPASPAFLKIDQPRAAMDPFFPPWPMAALGHRPIQSWLTMFWFLMQNRRFTSKKNPGRTITLESLMEGSLTRMRPKVSNVRLQLPALPKGKKRVMSSVSVCFDIMFNSTTTGSC